MLKDKVAIVTGAQQGIGKSIAVQFCKEGASDVIIWDLDEKKLRKTRDEIVKETGRNVEFQIVNITRIDEIQTAVNYVIDKYKRIDILVNNAGVFIKSLLIDMKEEEWDLIFDVNVKGTFLTTQVIAKQMIKQQGGKIINMSSCSAKKADPEQIAYNSSKSAIIGMTRVAALELGKYGIYCNAICPGATDTEMIRNTFLKNKEVEDVWIEKTALKKIALPIDIAKVAVFLASEYSDHITGESLIVSGGELMTQ